MIDEQKLKEISTKQLVENEKNLSHYTPISDVVMKNQATINIGTIGHVAHGKSSLVKAITGVATQKYSKERIRNITIKLGYANAKIYKCPLCPEPLCYKSFSSSKKEEEAICIDCNSLMVLKRHISFVDCPGHDVLMATMLNGAAIMDAGLLLVAANEECPQPQTREHLSAIEIMNMKYCVIIQNKIDLVNREGAIEQQAKIKEFTKYSIAENSPVIPISAQSGINIYYVLEYIVNYLPVPKRILNIPPKLIIIRSFDVNKPGAEVDKIEGGVVGGCILEGILKVGDMIEIRPGRLVYDENQQVKECQPLRTTVTRIRVEDKNELDFAVPGGLIAIGTLIDPSLTKSDKLAGNVLGYHGYMPKVYNVVELDYYLLNRVIGIQTSSNTNYTSIQNLRKDEKLKFNIGSTDVIGRVEAVKNDRNKAKIVLQEPVCSTEGERVAISRLFQTSWRLIGWGKMIKGQEIKLI